MMEHSAVKMDYVSEPARMTDSEFNLFSRFVYNELGIKMPPAKKLMLSTRLGRRLRSLGMDSYRDYYEYVFHGSGNIEELSELVDAVTTNKTEFYREPNQFSILTREVLPDLFRAQQSSSGPVVRAWCAGCSTGEEAYTIAFVIEEFLTSARIKATYEILATDISKRVLLVASEGMYRNESLRPIPVPVCRKYMMKGKGSRDGYHRIVPEIRRKIVFRRLNFMDNDYGIRGDLEIIFCRNVVIYFDRKTQVDFFGRLYDLLSPGGYLFIGSSETLFGISDRFMQAGPNVYRKI